MSIKKDLPIIITSILQEEQKKQKEKERNRKKEQDMLWKHSHYRNRPQFFGLLEFVRLLFSPPSIFWDPFS